jgi:hypothetical protein
MKSFSPLLRLCRAASREPFEQKPSQIYTSLIRMSSLLTNIWRLNLIVSALLILRHDAAAQVPWDPGIGPKLHINAPTNTTVWITNLTAYYFYNGNEVILTPAPTYGYSGGTTTTYGGYRPPDSATNVQVHLSGSTPSGPFVTGVQTILKPGGELHWDIFAGANDDPDHPSPQDKAGLACRLGACLNRT